MGILLVSAMGVASPSMAQLGPTDTLTIVTQYPPGGGSDLLAQVLAEGLRKSTGRTIVVEPKPGANGTIANAYVAQAKADGSVILFGSSGAMAINPNMGNPAKAVHPSDNFKPVALMAKSDLLLVANSDLPVKTVKELVDLAKKEPGKLNYASAGIGSSPHLAGALLCHLAGIEMTHVPYKGSGPTFVDLVAGRTQVTFAGLGISLPYLQEGKVKVLATGGSSRSPQLPDVPTIAESGVPDYEMTVWYGLFVPKGVPDETVLELNKEIQAALAMPEVKEQIEKANYTVDPKNSPEDFAKRVKTDFEKWGKYLPQMGL